MRPLFIVIVAALFPFSAAAATFVYNNCLEGNGKARTETREISGFEVVDSSGAFDIEIKSSAPAFRVRVTADENILPHIITSLQGNRLMIFPDRAICPEVGPRVEIEMPSLEAIVSSGSDNINASAINAGGFDLLLDGSSDIRLEGRARRLDATLSGSGSIDATHLRTESTTVDISGSGDAAVNASRLLKVDISGVGDVSYVGRPDRIEQNVSGVGVVSPTD